MREHDARARSLERSRPTSEAPRAGACRSRRAGAGARSSSAATTYVLGAPELFPLGDLAGARAEQEARAGPARGRVRTDGGALHRRRPRRCRPGSSRSGSSCSPSACATDARETVAFFQLAGRRAEGALGRPPRDGRRDRRRRRHPGRRRPGRRPRRSPPTRPSCRRSCSRAQRSIGRISPEGKRASSRRSATTATTSRWSATASTTCPALKAARLAIAQGSGVADGAQRRRPRARPGRLRERAGARRRGAAACCATCSACEALRREVGVRGVPRPLDRLTPKAYPLLPRHLTLARGARRSASPRSSSRSRRARAVPAPSGFLRDVARFAVPAGTAAGLGVLSSYLFALERARPAAPRGAARSRRRCSSSSGCT